MKTLYGKNFIKRDRDSECAVTLKYFISYNYAVSERFGVIISKISVYRNGYRKTESRQVSNIFHTEKQAMQFAKLLIRNFVTPMTLQEIAEEYISDKVECRYIEEESIEAIV